MAHTDKTAGGALHAQISNSIREKIYSREWTNRQKIPSEHELCSAFDVSRGTVRRAIKSLVDEGILVQRHGLGTFVADRAISHPAGVRPLSFADSLKRQGKKFDTAVILNEVVGATEEIARNLNIPVGSRVLHLLRVRRVDGEPIICQDSYENLIVCPGLEEYDFTRVSAFDAVQQSSGQAITKALIRYSARVAGDTMAELLDIEVASSMLVLEQNIEIEDGTIIEWSFTWLKAGQEVVGTAIQS